MKFWLLALKTAALACVVLVCLPIWRLRQPVMRSLIRLSGQWGGWLH